LDLTLTAHCPTDDGNDALFGTVPPLRTAVQGMGPEQPDDVVRVTVDGVTESTFSVAPVIVTPMPFIRENSHVI
jgi:hypothetical protein